MKKPRREIFEAAVARLGLTSDQNVFVGDHPQNDIEGAHGAGILAIWKRNTSWGPCYTADGIIDELPDLRIVLNEFAALQ